jgi:hypothetical protein
MSKTFPLCATRTMCSMTTLLCPTGYLSACQRINSRKLPATSGKCSAIPTISLVIVVSSVMNCGILGLLGLTKSKNIASSSGIPFGSKICAASLMISS